MTKGELMEFQEIYQDFKLDELEKEIQELASWTPFSFEKMIQAIYANELGI